MIIYDKKFALNNSKPKNVQFIWKFDSKTSLLDAETFYYLQTCLASVIKFNEVHDTSCSGRLDY